ncbi:hypothetical protein [Marinomonas sp. THO17]|uniref:hypothetical protein n=1 Tax=Marinomonas sp. THO17 TaxID=3149048 RepID=UPI00336BC45F
MSLPSSHFEQVIAEHEPAYLCLKTASLMNWSLHYQAESIDLRYFFHSGWSS